jgi:deoxyhypusine synthase
MPVNNDPVSKSRYMGSSKAQIPLRISDEMIRAAEYHIEKIDGTSGYQSRAKFLAAQRWIRAMQADEYVWLSVAGAATPVGFGGMFADIIDRGLVDVIVTTGANVYHDLHFACGLPVRHGSHTVNDNDLRADETTRIYNQFIHNRYTLKAQDMLNQEFARKLLPRLKSPFSTATLLYNLGREMLDDNSGAVIDKKGSFVLRAAEYDVPVFLDSGSNHSLGMDLSLLALEGLNVDTSPTRDVLESAALSIYTQPQLNIFLGEGGPRNFTQTTAPTASEIFYIPFQGSAGCIKFTTADERTGGISGSGEAEAVTWGKYVNSRPDREIEVWGEYTLTAPDVFAFVAGKVSRKPKRLMKQLDDILDAFLENVKKHETERKTKQRELRRQIRSVVAFEKEARARAGYKF